MSKRQRHDVAIEALQASVYEIPTEAREADGTLAWSVTTLVGAEALGGGRRGRGGVTDWLRAAAVAASNTQVSGHRHRTRTPTSPLPYPTCVTWSTSTTTSASRECCSMGRFTRAAACCGRTSHAPASGWSSSRATPTCSG